MTKNIDEITEIAEEFGFDLYPMRNEICRVTVFIRLVLTACRHDFLIEALVSNFIG